MSVVFRRTFRHCKERALKAIDIHKHFMSIADWLDPATTVDKIIIGDPQKEISRIAVSWISSFDAIKAAVAQDCQMLITHEPTFWSHTHEYESAKQWNPGTLIHDVGTRKKRFIEENGLVILRLHDTWDRMPEIGIPWAWADFLGFGPTPARIGESGCQHRYDIRPTKLDDLATRIAARTTELGEHYVEVVGDGSQMVSKVGIGTGCICHIHVYREMDCDVSVIVDDGTHYWRDIQMAADDGHPIICVNHATAEEPGMVTLTRYLNETLPGITAIHLPRGCSFRLVG